MKAEGKRYDSYEESTGSAVAGITLLEAYSALTSRSSAVAAAVEIPFPGQPKGTDPDANFWTLRIRNVG